nr:hypothetical protein [uncultured Eisenbergiella sp.]
MNQQEFYGISNSNKRITDAVKKYKHYFQFPYTLRNSSDGPAAVQKKQYFRKKPT